MLTYTISGTFTHFPWSWLVRLTGLKGTAFQIRSSHHSPIGACLRHQPNSAGPWFSCALPGGVFLELWFLLHLAGTFYATTTLLQLFKQTGRHPAHLSVSPSYCLPKTTLVQDPYMQVPSQVSLGFCLVLNWRKAGISHYCPHAKIQEFSTGLLRHRILETRVRTS